MGRFKETKDYGGLVTRTVPTAERAFTSVLAEKRKPVLSSTVQLQHDIVDLRLQDTLRAMLHSGVLEKKLAADSLPAFLGTRNTVFPSINDKPNEFLIQGFGVHINGYNAEVRGSRFNGGSLFSADWNSIQLNPPPAAGQRTDLLFLEFWLAIITSGSPVNVPSTTEIFPLGNRNWGDDYFDNDLIDTSFNPQRATDGRVQLQYQWRVVDGVSRSVTPDPMLNPLVTARGNNGTPTTYAFTRKTAQLDAGLYVAGDGSATAKAQLGSTTGFLYAIPVALVSRRNQEPYNVSTNPNGSNVSVASAGPSDRDDGLFYDEVTENDIEDLRHSIWPSLDLGTLLQAEMEALMRDERVDLRVSPTGSQQAGLIVQADAISDPDLPGIHEFARPDGVRTSFVINPDPQIAVDTVIPNTPDAVGQVRMTHAGSLRIVEVEVDAPNTLGNVTLRWRNDQSIVAETGRSSPTDQRTDITLNTAHSNYQAGGTIDVIYEINYEDGAAFLKSVQDVLRVYRIDNVAAEHDIHYVEESDEFRQEDTGVENVSGHPDFRRDFNYLDAGYQAGDKLAGYNRLEFFHQAGSGGNTYIIPAQVGGKNVRGVFQLQEVSGPSPVHVVPTSVTRNGNGTHTVVTPSGFATNKVLRWTLVVETEGTIYSQDRRGLPLTSRIEELSFMGNGVDTVVKVEADARVISLPCFLDATLTRRAYAYVGGQRVLVTYQILSERSVQITLPFLTTDEVLIPVLTEWPIPLDEALVVVYNFRAYSGLSGFPVLPFSASDVFEVVAVGQAFMHSYGSGNSGFPTGWLSELADRLPQAALTPADFVGTEFEFADSVAPTRFAHRPTGYQLVDAESQRLGIGSKFTIQSVGGTVEQGLSGYQLVPEQGGRFDIQRPQFSYPGDAGPIQLVAPYLVKGLLTDEHFLLVVVHELTSEGQAANFDLLADSDTSFDLYTTRDRWLIRR